MTWPNHVLKQFEIVNRFTTVTDATEFYGPFNTLLFHLFPPTEDYQIAPKLKRIKGTYNFSFLFIIMKHNSPVLFIEIGTYLSFEKNFLRKEADDHMRDRFLEFSSESLSIPKLYGLSALGTRFSVYEYDKTTRRLTPPRIPPDTTILNDTAPRERWNYDIMEDLGEAKLVEIVQEIKQMVTGDQSILAARNFVDFLNGY